MHHKAIGASTSAWRSSMPSRPARKPGPPIHVSGTSSSDHPWETDGTVIEPWPSSQPVVQYQI